MAELLKLRPSAAHRWYNCPGSVEYDEIKQPDNEYMITGKIAHKLAELAIYAGKLPSELPYTEVLIEVDGVEGPHEIPDDVPPLVDVYVVSLCAAAGDNPITPETKIEIAGCPDGGTIDAYILSPELLQIHDLKFGRKPVQAKNDEQLILYASGLIALLDSIAKDISGEFPVSLSIHQPLIGIVDTWNTTAAEIIALAIKMACVATDIQSGDRTCCPGDKQCCWCKGKGKCSALEQRSRNSISDDFNDITQPLAPAVVTGAIERAKTSDLSALGAMLQTIPLIEQWLDALRVRAKEELIAGRDVPGWKLVAGKQGARKWSDEAAAEKKMVSIKLKKEDRYEMKLLSPSKLEKLVGKEKMQKFAEIIEQAPGSPTIAPESDKRKKLEIADVSLEFQNLLTSEEEV